MVMLTCIILKTDSDYFNFLLKINVSAYTGAEFLLSILVNK